MSSPSLFPSNLHRATLPHRAVLIITGKDWTSFLQSLVSNDVTQLSEKQSIWAALLTPQGRWVSDFFLYKVKDKCFLECEDQSIPLLIQTFAKFKLRADVQVERATNLHVQVEWFSDPEKHDHHQVIPISDDDSIKRRDPRLNEAGYRMITATALSVNSNADYYDRFRLQLGLPDGSKDCISGLTLPIEAGFDHLNGLSFTKGCYMGQEVTARIHYRGILKRRLTLVQHSQKERKLPPVGTVLYLNDIKIGVMRSSNHDIGLAILKTDIIGQDIATCDGAILRSFYPLWYKRYLHKQ